MAAEPQPTPPSLSAGESRFRAIVDAFGDPILMLDRYRMMRYVNAAFISVFGYTRTDVISRSIEELLTPAELPGVCAALDFETQGDDPTVRIEHHLRRRDGIDELVETAAHLLRDPSGQPTIVLHLRVVTEQRRLAREQAVRFAVTQILAFSPDLDIALAQAARAIATSLGWRAVELWLPDNVGRSLRWHAGWRPDGCAELDAYIAAGHQLAFAAGDGLIGRAWSTGELQWDADIAASGALLRAAMAAEAGLRAAVAVPLGQGDDVAGVMLFYSEAAHAPDQALTGTLADLGRQIGQFVARKRAEHALEDERASLARRVEERTAELRLLNGELARAMRAKDAFLATMSHELRTPLTTILAVSELLQEQIRGPLNERQQASLATVVTSGRHLLGLINDVLDISKVEAGRLELQIERVSVAEICQVSLMFVRELALKKQLQLGLLLHDQLATIDADPKRLKQMLVNLLSNAVKFTPDGGAVRLEVKADGAAGRIRFAVHDTGIGIDAAQQPLLFQPFVQLNSGLRRSQEGTGLGLALVWRLADLHGGRVELTSEPGVGSCFAITLPLRQPGAPAPPPETDAPAHGPPVGAVALVIEDTDSAAEQLARHLRSLDLRAVIHPGGEGALERARQLAPAVIVLDLLMPGASGWNVLRDLKADPQTQATPVIIISVADERAAGLAAGAAAYLVKPVARADLRDALRAIGRLPDATRAALRGAPDLVRPRVLLVDDNPNAADIIGEYLEARGYTVVVANGGAEALAQAEAAAPDIILLDIQMPEIDGLEVLRRLRATPTHAATPILALTALAMPEDRERCLAAGATDYMAKPVSLRRLAQEVGRLLEP